MDKNDIKKILYLWVDAYKDDLICGTISDLPPTTDDCNKWLSDDYKIAFDFTLSRIELIKLFGLSQSDVDRLLNDEVYTVSFNNLGPILETPITIPDTLYVDGALIKSDPSAKIYYDKNEHKNVIDEYNLKSCI